MPQISRTTNPTGLKRLDAKLFSVRVQTTGGGQRSFWLEKFDFSMSGLTGGLLLSCVAHAGNTEEFFRLGFVDTPIHDPRPLVNLSTSKPLRFRFFAHAEGDPKLVAFADGVRAADEAGVLGSSLVDIEPGDLGGPSWKLVLPDDKMSADKPVLMVERRLFPTAQAAANSPWMGVLVMPEVFRQIAVAISKDFGALDNAETWMYPWAEYLKSVGADLLPEDADDSAREGWIEEVVAAFCAKAVFRQQLERVSNELSGGQI